MKTYQISRYIAFGALMKSLQNLKKGYPVCTQEGVVFFIKEWMNFLEELNLKVTLRVAKNILKIIKELEKNDINYKLTEDDAKQIRYEIEKVSTTLFAEAEGTIAYITTEKRIDVEKLYNNVSSLMRPEIFEFLSDIAQYDFKEAGKCIAFERPTAAAFHLLRGTEEVLRHYYCGIVKRNRINKLMWGPIIIHLRARVRNKPSKPLLDSLDNIRVNFRNATQHPEMRYDIEEVQDLFPLCVDVINRMVTHLKEINIDK